jgi:DnaK suppressor protein
MTLHDESTVLSDVQAEAIGHELREQLMWRTTRLAELTAQVEASSVSDGSRQAVLAELAANERIMADIRRSLERIADRTYGQCVDCRTTIPYERLKIRPLTRHCMPCRRRHESR